MTIKWHMLAAETIERRFELAGLPQGWLAVGAIIALTGMLAGSAWLYHREQRTGASRRARLVLAILRCTAILLLAVVWLEPIIAVYVHREIDSRTLLLVDGSASMGLRDRYSQPDDNDRVGKVLGDDRDVRTVTRGELAGTALGGPELDLCKELAARNALMVYRFGDRLEPLGIWTRAGKLEQKSNADGNAKRADKPAATSPANNDDNMTPGNGLEPADSLATALAHTFAPATDIGRAVRQAVELQAGAPIAAVIVVSDGQFNRGEPAEVIGQFARGRKIPVHCVGIGDPAEPRNAAVTAIEAPPNVFVKDPFKVTAQIRTRGLAGQRLEVELLQGRAGAEPTQPVDRRSVVVAVDGQVPPVVFTHNLGEAEQVRLLVRVNEREDETLTDDNIREVTVRALDNKMRVLLVAAAPTWDYRYLSRLLERDATMDVSCWLQSADETAVRDGNTVIDHLPVSAEELAAYDCVILMDPQSQGFDSSWAETVENLVANNGSGLLYVAGRKNAARFLHDPGGAAVATLLPVTIDAGEADLIINELGHFQTMAWPLNVPPEVANHPVLALAEQGIDNAELWSRLPGVYWHYPVRRAKPVATVFLRHSNPRMRSADGGHVLLATQFLGSGRTGFMAFEGTWRWRRFGDTYFNRFWIHLLRHLVEGKLLSGQKRGLIQVDRDSYAAGEPVVVEARLLDERHLPLDRSEMAMTVRHESEGVRSASLQAQPGRPGWYRSRLVPMQTGLYSLQIDLSGTDGEPVAIRGEFRVGKADLEFRQTPLDKESLKSLAAQSAGGQYLEVDETERLVGLIPSKTVSLVLTAQPVVLWDRWWTLAALVFLLGLEWFLRKRACLL